MEVRPITFEEIETVLELHWQGLEHEIKILHHIFPFKDANPSGKEPIKEILQDCVISKTSQILGAFKDNQCLGYILGTQKHYPAESPSKCGSVNGLFVNESYRRLGVGKALFKGLSDWFSTQNIDLIELAYMINDPQSEAFWVKQGFKPVQILAMKSLND